MQLLTEPPSWATWGEWGECSESCEGGDRTRSRVCEDSSCPDETDCAGDNEDSERCNEDVCCPGKFIGVF